MRHLVDLTGQKIIVTGASSGLGRGIAELLASHGAQLVLTGRNAEKLNKVLTSLSGSGHYAEPFDLNATDRICDWIKAISVRVGALNGLVHSAGIQATKPIKFLTTSDWESSFRINVIAGAMLAKGFRVRGINANSGSIVYLSSVMGLTGKPGQILYSATKGALVSMTRSMALELARDNIRVNCIAPAIVVSGMSADIEKTVGPMAFAEIVSQHPLGLGRVEDVASATAFLLSDASRWITGTTLTIDGGYTAQ